MEKSARPGPNAFRRALAVALCGVLWLLLAAPLASQSGAQRGFYYRVQEGETLDQIARTHRVSAYEIARQNRLDVRARPAPGTRLWIPGSPAPAASRPAAASPTRSSTPANRPATTPQRSSTSPGTVVVQRGDSLWRIANQHGTTVSALADANGLARDAMLEIGQVLHLPGSPGTRSGGDTTPRRAEPARDQQAAPSPAREIRGGSGQIRTSSRGYSWPVEGRVIRRFENRASSKHFGLDIAVPVGTEVRAARDGTVVYAGSTISAYGNMVIIRHDDNFATCYAHNRSIRVRVDQRVQRGDVIALSGDTGRGSEPHLHFQIRRNGDAVDPMPFLP